MEPLERANELARAGVPPNEIAAALYCEGHMPPEGYVPFLTECDPHALQALAGLAHQRHALYLHGLFDPKAAEFQATNKLGYSRGSMDRELGALAKDLQSATQAELLERLAVVAGKLGAHIALPQGENRARSLPIGQVSAKAHEKPGIEPAIGTTLGTVIDVEPKSP